MRISKFNGRARAFRDSRDWRASGTRRRHRVEARDEASRILLNARLPRERRRKNDRVGHRHEVRAKAGALLLVAEARPRARGASGRRVARVDAILYTIRQFLFPSGLCVLDVFFSLVHSVADCCERASRKTLDAEQDLRNVNDPSAGSPTETLLRLLLPLNDQVWSSSRQHRQCRDIAAHQSEDLTKSFNR